MDINEIIVKNELTTREMEFVVEEYIFEVALDYFAKMKKLSESEFSQIYSIGIKNK
jgi:hypothetical protein